jgi:hypothetical protein
MTISNDLIDRLKKDVIDTMTKIRLDTKVNVYFCKEELSTDQKFGIGSQKIDVKHRTLYFFVDRAPTYNWGHPCQYILYDVDREKDYKTIEAEFPPTDYFIAPEKYEVIHESIKLVDTLEEKRNKMQAMPGLDIALKETRGERYAILFSGMSNNRHLNDLEFIYRSLTDLYQFSPSHIHVLNYDGTINYSGAPHPVEKWPGDDTAYKMKVNMKGNKSLLNKIIAQLAGELKKRDLLLIHVNNHGGGPPSDTESNICCYPDWDSYPASDFGAKLKTLPQFASLIIMMEQCHSGGFIKPVLKNSPAERTHIAAACAENKSSIGGPDFDPFARDWISGICGHYPDRSNLLQEVDTNHDRRVSASEAFVYADTVHDPYDTPCSGEKHRGDGALLFLG